jgi:MYXO-CTERM domain-containing protein
LALDSAGNLYAANNWDGKVIKFAPSNYPLNVGTVFADTGAPGLTGLAFDHAGDLFVSNTQAGTIQEITPGGAVSVFATGLGGPAGLAFDSVGDLYVVDQGYSPEYGAYAIVEFTPAGVGSVFASGLYGAEFIAIQPTPEPAAFSLLVLGGLGLLRRRAGRASPPLRGEPPKGGG